MTSFDQLGRPIASIYQLFENKKDDLLDDTMNVQQKAAVLRASSSVVAIISPDIPAEMTEYVQGMKMMTTEEGKVFIESGTIIECEDGGNGKFFITILTTSTLFSRTNGVLPAHIEVEVYLGDGKMYKGEVLGCDFNYNLAAVRIQSDAPMKTAELRGLDDVISIDPYEQRPHSSLFRILPEDMVVALGRLASSHCHLLISAGSFSMEYPTLDCKELYCHDGNHQGVIGGPAINCHGEVIGIMVLDRYFLPCNLVVKWWKYYKQHRTFCRPWLGLKVANLHTASCHFLEPFVRKFPNISTGVIVTKVAENSPAYSSGLCRQDVVVQCDGDSVRSTLEFFDKILDKTGRTVKFKILRLSSNESLELSMNIEETTPDNFYRWPIPAWWSRPRKRSHSMTESELEYELSENESSESK